jgi:hypothetical protein
MFLNFAPKPKSTGSEIHIFLENQSNIFRFAKFFPTKKVLILERFLSSWKSISFLQKVLVVTATFRKNRKK